MNPETRLPRNVREKCLRHENKKTYRPMTDFIKGEPPTLIAETMMVIIPRGAIPSNTVSNPLIDVARNCLVASSPKRVRSALKSANEKTVSSVVSIFDVLSFVAMVRNGESSFKINVREPKRCLGRHLYYTIMQWRRNSSEFHEVVILGC